MFLRVIYVYSFFFFNDTATTEIYTLSLHDALPISPTGRHPRPLALAMSVSLRRCVSRGLSGVGSGDKERSEEHTSELQSLAYLVCRLLLEKKKNKSKSTNLFILIHDHTVARLLDHT